MTVSAGQRPLPKVPDMTVLKGQTAIVTGAASGIGMATALALGRAGANVAVNYRSRDQEAQAVAEDEQIRAAGAEGIAIQADVSKEPDVDRMFEEVVARFGRVDILVANAGLQQDAPVHEMTLKQWQTVIDVNLTGQFLCCRAAVRAFKRQGIDPNISVAAGKIICMSSVHEVIPWAGHVNYAASKGGVMLMMKSIAQEVAPLGVRVNSIGPGAIRTGINREAWATEEAHSALMNLILYRRIGEVDDVARAAVWLASDAADYITGTTLMVDGGMCLYPGFESGG